MSFNTTKTKTQKRTKAVTHEGGEGYAYTSREELYMVITGSLLSGDNFYESKDERVSRIRSLIETEIKRHDGPEYIEALAFHARRDLYLRTTANVLVAELFLNGQGAHGRRAAKYVWQRADDHLESLAYAKMFCNQTFPRALLNAVAARLNELSEYAAVKYAGSGKTFSQRDALRLSHAKPKDVKQKALFHYINSGDWDALPAEEKAQLPEIASLRSGESTGLTWEQIISKEGSTPEAWQKAIDVMGYMALLRNLRNISQKIGNDKAIIEKVAAIIRDPNRVVKSKQLPYRFLSAYKALGGVIAAPGWWGSTEKANPQLLTAVSEAMNIAASNTPFLPGRTVVIVDVSGSMHSPISQKSQVNMVEAAASVGAMAARQTVGDLWVFGTDAAPRSVHPNEPVVSICEKICTSANEVGHGTNISLALDKALTGQSYDRILLFSDMQTMSTSWGTTASAKQVLEKKAGDAYYYGFNLAGYGVTIADKNPKRIEVGGFSDKILDWIRINEKSNPAQEILTQYRAFLKAQEPYLIRSSTGFVAFKKAQEQ